MKIKSQKDFLSGLMFVITGLAFALGAQYYAFGNSARPGPGYFPTGLGVLMAILGAFVLFEALTIETYDGGLIGRFAWKPLITILLAVTLFGLTVMPLGMSVALPLLIIVSSLAGGEFRWKGVLINCVVLTIGSWAIFILGLKLVIPLWPAFLAGR